MFEITKNDGAVLEQYITHGKAYKNGIYDFTFENRYLIYHADLRNVITYLALDMETECASEICHGTEIDVSGTNYESLIPQIFRAIRYTGDQRYLNAFVHEPLEVIDSVFRVMLPSMGYTVREEQIRLSKNIYLGLMGKKVAICEAEVGTGKTMAYLVAAVCAKKQTETNRSYGEPVTITTSSIELQKSLVEKEIPRLSQILEMYGLIDKPLTAVLRKGKEHYFCPLRYADYISNISQHAKNYRETLKFFRENCFGQIAFDLDKVKLPGYLKDRLCVKGSCGHCSHGNCQYHNYINQALNIRQALDFQITNHNLYIMSAKQSGLLRPSRYVIIDEAHKFKTAAQDVYGGRVEEMDVVKYLRWIKNQCACHNDRKAYEQASVSADALNKRLFAQLKSRKDSLTEEKNVLIPDREMKHTIQKLCQQLDLLEESRKKNAGRQEISVERIHEMLMECAYPNRNTIWLEEDEAKRLSLCFCPKDVSLRLTNGMWRGATIHVLTSGTMSDGVDFDFFKKETGLDVFSGNDILETMTKSPFDYANHSRLYLPQDMPFPNEDDPRYLKAVSDRIVDLVYATAGHTAILFTSYKLLNKIHHLTSQQLSEYEVICMAKSNKTAIADFKRSKNGVLFAAGTMWEGVDCPGDCLSSVIIVRLPFPRRTAALEEQKKQYPTVQQFVNMVAVPEMLIKLRQGAGRLIRTESDTGVLTILDSRATNGVYADRIMQALGKYPSVETLSEVEAFMKQVKPESYYNGGNVCDYGNGK